MNFDLTTALRSLQGMAIGFLQQFPYILIALLVYAAFHIAARLTRKVIRNLTKRRRKHRNVGLVLGRLAEGGLMLVGVLVALVIAISSFQPSQLIQLLGISGVAIGFAFRDILQNFLAGILILLTEPFHLGDQIVVGSYEGTVGEIETRATSIRTYDGRRVVIPNSNLFTQSVTVNTAFEKRRLQYDIGVGYGDDIARAQNVILDALRGAHGVLQEPAPEALVVDLAGSSVNIRARWWINPPLRMDVMVSRNEGLRAIKNALTAKGIDLPFPTRQVLFHEQTEQTDGDRARQREGWPAGKGEVPGPRSTDGALTQGQGRDDDKGYDSGMVPPRDRAKAP
jgi:small-conductance mechanosensitive channel